MGRKEAWRSRRRRRRRKSGEQREETEEMREEGEAGAVKWALIGHFLCHSDSS